MFTLGRRLAALLIAAAAAPAQDAPPPLAIVGATVVPMDREGSLPDHTVLVSGGRIVAVGPVAEVAVPEGATVIDAHGLWLMPGLVDMHVHSWFESELTLFLANGVTTVRNMFGSPRQVQWRDEVAAGTRLGPTIVTAGPIVDGSPPVWPGSFEVTTAVQAREAVQAHVDGHYDFVKVYDRLSPEMWAAVVAAAKDAGLPVMGHVPARVGLHAVFASGQRTVEHLFGFEACLAGAEAPAEPGGLVSRLHQWVGAEPAQLQALSAEAAAAGVFQCPTLVVLQKMAVGADDAAELARPCMRYVEPFMLSTWERSAEQLPAEYATAAKEGQATRNALVGALRAAGAPLMLGSDCGNSWVVAGFAVHEELANLVACGLSPAEALRAATRTPAECLRATGEFGAVAPGLRADLLLLQADPLQDVANAQLRAGLVVRGRWMPESELQALLESVAQTAPAAEAPVDDPK
jgi:imidazolonepropionase-like amidohydrolase